MPAPDNSIPGRPLVGGSASNTVDTQCPVSPLEVDQPIKPVVAEIRQQEGPTNQAPLPGCIIPGIGFIAYRYVALVLLVTQTVLAIFVMRVSRTKYVDPQTPYLVSTAVTLAELIKLISSVGLVWKDSRYDLYLTYAQIKSEIIENPMGTLRIGLPAFLYTLQNNLLFIALSNVSGAVYQITYQLKILTTALLSVLILHKRLSVDQWASLILLTLGVALIQLPTSSAKEAPVIVGDPLIGVAAVLAACVTSGFAGVYLEKVLKDTKTSIWLRNIQLGLLGFVLALLGAFWTDGTKIYQHGFFQGYNFSTWMAILLQSAGGLIVAAVLKYADNILKCFGNAVAIILSCIVSYYFVGDYVPTFLFVIGTIAVSAATYTYGTNFPIWYSVVRPKALLKKIVRLFVNKRKPVPVIDTSVPV